MGTSSNYRLGSLWLVSFDPSVGTEIRKTRPAVIVSGTAFNRRSKVTLLPITSATPDQRLLSVVVPIAPSNTNGLNVSSFIVCVDPMTFDKQRLVKRLGELQSEQINQVQTILRSYLELD
jgi:mRNA interferase MazF